VFGAIASGRSMRSGVNSAAEDLLGGGATAADALDPPPFGATGMGTGTSVFSSSARARSALTFRSRKA
jgi:hypothetical protein